MDNKFLDLEIEMKGTEFCALVAATISGWVDAQQGHQIKPHQYNQILAFTAKHAPKLYKEIINSRKDKNGRTY